MPQVRNAVPKYGWNLGSNNPTRQKETTINEEPTIKDLSEVKPDYTKAMDVRGEPTHVCPCGSEMWNVKVMFQDYEISMYMLDMECVLCGTKATAPTLVDMPEDYVKMEDRRVEE